jgi:hypothetical protein
VVPRRVPKLAQTHPPGTGVGVSPEAATAPEIAPGTSLGMPWDGLSPAAPRVIPRRVPQVALFWPISALFDPLPDPPSWADSGRRYQPHAAEPRDGTI